MEGSGGPDVGRSRRAKMLGADPAAHKETRHRHIVAVHTKLNSRGESCLNRSLK